MSPLPFQITPPSAALGGSYAALLAEAQDHLRSVLGLRLELFSNVSRVDDLQAAQGLAARLMENSSTIFVLGIGGSSLGGQAIADLLPRGAARMPNVVFWDNPDPYSFGEWLGACDLKTTRFLVVSKSGGTAETLMQALAAKDALAKAGGGKYLAQHFAVITEPRDSALARFAKSVGCPVLDHPLGIGGRYSVLSVVGLLPALLMGLDTAAIRRGARAVLENPESAVAGAALHRALGVRETVLWPYADKLKTFGAWWRQLWAESLGKNGQGSTPVAALGPVDQHSQLQLFLDGPGGALFTLVTAASEGIGPVAPAEDARALGLDYLAGRHMGDLVAAEARATLETLTKRGRPVRHFHVSKVDEEALGALFMHFMLETILMARLMGVDAFDQPAVEEGKVLARAYLSGKSG